MNRFNLTFSGEILPGQEPEQVKLRFGELFDIDDPDRLERFFSGQTIVLRRNLERKAAAECFQQMRQVGVVAELVKVTTAEAANAVAGTAAAAAPSTRPGPQSGRGNAAREREEAEREREIAEREKARLERERQEAEEERRKNEQRAREAEERRARKAEEKARRAAATRERKAKEQARRDAERQRKQAEREREKAEREQEKARLAAEKAEAAAREKARIEAARREAEEKAAKLRAEQEKARAEAEARAQAEEEQRRRRAAEEAARQRILMEEQRRREEAAERQREKEQREREAAERERERAERERERAERERERAERERERAELEQAKAELARKEAELQRKEAEHRAREAAAQARESAAQEARAQDAQRDADAERRLLEEGAIQRAARELSQGSAVKPVQARVRTRLDVKKRDSEQDSAPVHKRQPGEPNLYQLRPFRNTGEVRERAARALRGMRHALAAAFASGSALLGILFLSQQYPPPSPIQGASGVAADEAGNLVLLAGDTLLLHDRAGLATGSLDFAALGVSSLQGPLSFAGDGSLLAIGESASSPGASTLLRCDLQAPGCASHGGVPEGVTVTAYAEHPLDGSLLIADGSAGELLRTGRDGDIRGRAALQLPPQPVLRLHAGLLMMNSAEGPAVSVYRYDDNAFAQQLDEILLLPPGAAELGHDRVANFLANGDRWWAVMYGADGGAPAVYRFDDSWSPLGPAVADADVLPLELTAWGNRTLVDDHAGVDIARFNELGEAAAPFRSESLATLVDQRRRAIQLNTVGARGSLLLCALLLAAALAIAYAQRARALVYRSSRGRGAEPVDDYATDILWIGHVTDRRNRLRRLGASYAVLALAACLLAMGAGASAVQLAALLFALAGPGAGLMLLGRRPPGNLGLHDRRLMLVDHSGQYHIGGGSDIRYRGNFLAMDDVLLFTGNALLPAFPATAIQAQVTPLVAEGVRIDRKTLLVKLLQGRHPIALATLASCAGFAAAIILLAIDALF